MKNNCIHCDRVLRLENRAKKEAGIFRNICKGCDNDQHNKRKWIRGELKKYPCEYCGIECMKFGKRALCSLKCRILGNIHKDENNCWIWLGRKTNRGYGEIMINGKRRQLTRIVYDLFKGPLIVDKFVCHSCDNKTCINPDHLWLGTNADNQKDFIMKYRSDVKAMGDYCESLIHPSMRRKE